MSLLGSVLSRMRLGRRAVASGLVEDVLVERLQFRLLPASRLQDGADQAHALENADQRAAVFVLEVERLVRCPARQVVRHHGVGLGRHIIPMDQTLRGPVRIGLERDCWRRAGRLRDDGGANNVAIQLPACHVEQIEDRHIAATVFPVIREAVEAMPAEWVTGRRNAQIELGRSGGREAVPIPAIVNGIEAVVAQRLHGHVTERRADGSAGRPARRCPAVAGDKAPVRRSSA